MTKITHSEKAKQTIETMNSEPTAWRLATIVWEKMLATVPTKVKCPVCNGRGRVWVNPTTNDVICAQYDTGAQVRKEQGLTDTGCLSYAAILKWENESGNTLTACPRCPTRRNYYMGSGEIVEMVKREVLVGRIIWDAGTEFTSRFRYTDGRSMTHCELCAKGINHSNRVPVQGVTRDGQAIAMWVGEDCARKILNVVAKFKKDQFIADNLKPVAKV